MKKIIIIIIFFLIVSIFFTIFLERTPQSLSEAIQSAPYSITDYKANVFDCSNMSALLNDYLRNKGFDCSILIVNTGTIKNIDHSFVKCGDYYIEATEKRILTSEEKNLYESYPIEAECDGNSILLKEMWTREFGEEWANKEWDY